MSLLDFFFIFFCKIFPSFRQKREKCPFTCGNAMTEYLTEISRGFRHSVRFPSSAYASADGSCKVCPPDTDASMCSCWHECGQHTAVYCVIDALRTMPKGVYQSYYVVDTCLELPPVERRLHLLDCEAWCVEPAVLLRAVVSLERLDSARSENAVSAYSDAFL